jgi:hypothetical protein
VTRGASGMPPGAFVLRALPVLIVALLGLRVVLAGWPGLWIDEAFSLYHARAPLGDLWGEGWRLESSPPLYYSTLWAWIRVVGDSEIAARLLSVGLTGVSTWLVCRAATTLAGRTAGLFAAACWLLPALAVEYSLEIRPYALTAVFVAAATAALARALVEQREGRIRGAGAGAGAAVRAVAPIVLAGTAAFYTHTTAFSALVGLAAATAYFGWRTRAGAGYAKAWAAGCAALALLCLPHLGVALGVLGSNRDGLAWIPSSFDPRYVSHVVRQLVLGQVVWPGAVTVPLALAVYAGLAAAAWRLRDRADVIAIGVVLPLAGGLALWLAGAIQPILMARTLLWTWVPLSVLVGCVAVRLDGRRPMPRLIAIAALLLSAATLAGLLAQRDVQRPWHAALQALEAAIRPGDRLLLLDPEIGCVVDRYGGPALRAAPRAQLRMGAHQTFWSGQRIDIGCNALPSATEAEIGTRPGVADWVLIGDGRQADDVSRMLTHERARLRADGGITVGGRSSAVRIVGADGAAPGPR